MAKLTPTQKAKAKAMSSKRGVKYPNAWSNLAVAKSQKPKKKTTAKKATA
jgi:hypothetical protein